MSFILMNKFYFTKIICALKDPVLEYARKATETSNLAVNRNVAIQRQMQKSAGEKKTRTYYSYNGG